MRRRLLGLLARLIGAPVLHGDGVADDSVALRHWGRGGLVRTPDGRGWWRELDGMTFRPLEPIVISSAVTISNCHFDGDVLQELERLETLN